MHNLSKHTAVIFDVDGVLVDSVPYHFDAWKKTFKLFDISLSFADYQNYLNGVPRNEGIRRVLQAKKIKDDELLQIIAVAKQKRYLMSVKNNPPKPLPGVVPLLMYLKKHHIRTAAASSSKNARLLLSVTHLTDYFTAIVDGNDFIHPKPDPDIFLTAAKRLSVASKECIVIEDAVVGAQAACAMKAYVVGLLTSGETEIASHCQLTLLSLRSYRKILKLV